MEILLAMAPPPGAGGGGGGVLSTIILIVIIVLFLIPFFRKGSGLKISGPELVVTRFNIDENSEDLNVEIVGRASGITAWLLTTMGLDETINFLVHKTKIEIKSASLSGELHQAVPLTSVASAHCGYSKPVFVLFFGIIIFFIGLVASLAANISGLFLFCLVIGGVFVLIYFLAKKISIVLETSGGMQLSISFKRSVIENVSIDLEQALKVINIINMNIVEQQKK